MVKKRPNFHFFSTYLAIGFLQEPFHYGHNNANLEDIFKSWDSPYPIWHEVFFFNPPSVIVYKINTTMWKNVTTFFNTGWELSPPQLLFLSLPTNTQCRKWSLQNEHVHALSHCIKFPFPSVLVDYHFDVVWPILFNYLHIVLIQCDLAILLLQ